MKIVIQIVLALMALFMALDSTSIEVLQVDSALFSYGGSQYCITGTDTGAIKHYRELP